MDRKAASEFLGVSEKTVSRYVASGRLPAQRLGQSLTIAQADLKRLKTEFATPVPAFTIWDSEGHSGTILLETSASATRIVVS